MVSLISNANNSTSGASTSVTSLERLLMATLAQVIRTSVDNDSAAQDRVGANQLYKAVLEFAFGEALAIGLDVAQVTNVPDLILGSTVGLAVGVEVRASGSAAVGVVAELVDVHAASSIRVYVLDLVLDDSRGRL